MYRDDFEGYGPGPIARWECDPTDEEIKDMRQEELRAAREDRRDDRRQRKINGRERKWRRENPEAAAARDARLTAWRARPGLW